jgi:hypothetical protein
VYTGCNAEVLPQPITTSPYGRRNDTADGLGRVSLT